MFVNKVASLLRWLAHDDALGLFKHYAQQSTDARRSGANNQNRVFLGYLAYACSPKARGKHIAHKQSLLVGNAVWNAV